MTVNVPHARPGTGSPSPLTHLQPFSDQQEFTGAAEPETHWPMLLGVGNIIYASRQVLFRALPLRGVVASTILEE